MSVTGRALFKALNILVIFDIIVYGVSSIVFCLVSNKLVTDIMK